MLPPHIRYNRNEGTLPVYGWVWHREGALGALDTVL